MKAEPSKIYAAYDFLKVVLSLPNVRTNNKQDTSHSCMSTPFGIETGAKG